MEVAAELGEASMELGGIVLLPLLPPAGNVVEDSAVCLACEYSACSSFLRSALFSLEPAARLPLVSVQAEAAAAEKGAGRKAGAVAAGAERGPLITAADEAGAERCGIRRETGASWPSADRS